jgi:ABC-type multidrug transport system permease subunit
LCYVLTTGLHQLFLQAHQSTINALPFAHALYAARDVMVHGVGFSDIAIDFYWVLGYTMAFFVLGVFLFRRRMLE